MWSLYSRQSFHVSSCDQASTSPRCPAVVTRTVAQGRGRQLGRAGLHGYILRVNQQMRADHATPLILCQASKAAGQVIDVKEAHKVFDEAFVTVKSGDGGSGEIVEAGRGKYVKNNKYHAGANQPKQLWLPASDPADGADGADVYVVCDPSLDNLLHLHQRKQWVAAKGARGNPAVGSAGPKRNSKLKKAVTPPLEIPVPPGTVIKRKSTGQVLGEVIQPGDRVLVAKGGKGGMGIRAPSRIQKQKELRKELKTAAKTGSEIVSIDDVNWRDDSKGLPGQQLGLHLLMRVVADVGIVGFPNAGKSSLLSALTRARPEVAPYPFTTLMPNLGVMAAGQGPVLADLPGLIEGAHQGKGLGRMFLRHLRRTRVLLHVVDASAADPATDYLAVREELRMYNPDYVARPHVVALNKMDLEDAGALREEVINDVSSTARQWQDQHAADIPGLTLPSALVPCSAVSGEGIQQLAAAIQSVLEELQVNGSVRQTLALQHTADASSNQLQSQPAAMVSSSEIAAAVSAALVGAAAASSSMVSEPKQAAAGGSWQDTFETQQQEDTDVEDECEGGYEDEFEEGDEWEELDLTVLGQPDGGESSWDEGEGSTRNRDGAHSSTGQESGAEPPLAADDPDRWLFDLTEEQLLELADKVE